MESHDPPVLIAGLAFAVHRVLSNSKAENVALVGEQGNENGSRG